MSSITIHDAQGKYEYSFTSGSSLMELLRSKGFGISAPCAGHGLCGKCRVTMLRDGVYSQPLACKTILEGDCQVYLPADSSSITWNAVSSVLPCEPGRTGLGAAVDLGTTTVAVSLYELSTGENMGSLSRWNAQKSWGADVISRVGHCMDCPSGLKEQSEAVREQIYDMIGELLCKAERPVSQLNGAYLAGNTVMEHIFAGISPESIAAAPYLPASYFENGEQVMLHGIPVYLSPCIAGYVGGDITAGILAAGIDMAEETALFIDVGTNGEIVLGNRDGLYCCAVACGPAFEGAGISCGMPASDGAICSVETDGETLSYRVVGGGDATGICGSGLLDLAACLLELGYIDESGYLEDDGGENFFSLTHRVTLTQRDVRQLQLAKAAVRAGIERLTEIAGIAIDSISRVYLSGGFGTRLRPESAVRIGMLPEIEPERITALGNTSLTGAAMALLDPSLRGRIQEIKGKCSYLELSSDARFNDLYVDAMSFPEQLF